MGESPAPLGPLLNRADRQTRQKSCPVRDSVGASELAPRRHESGSPIRPRSGGGFTTSGWGKCSERGPTRSMGSGPAFGLRISALFKGCGGLGSQNGLVRARTGGPAGLCPAFFLSRRNQKEKRRRERNLGWGELEARGEGGGESVVERGAESGAAWSHHPPPATTFVGRFWRGSRGFCKTSGRPGGGRGGTRFCPGGEGSPGRILKRALMTDATKVLSSSGFGGCVGTGPPTSRVRISDPASLRRGLHKISNWGKVTIFLGLSEEISALFKIWGRRSGVGARSFLPRLNRK